MNKWTMTIPFESQNNQKEIWTCKDSEKQKNYEVEVTLGKPIDILSLKLSIINDFNKSVAHIKDSRTFLYQNSALQHVDVCPICKAKTETMPEVFSVYGAHYVACQDCHHYYVKARPTKEALDKFYSRDIHYQSNYADKKTTEKRVQEVAIPKVKWAIQQFERIYKRKPNSILDVGAGSGHFVQACKLMGIKADGVEISESGRDFCKEQFGFDLMDNNFLREWKKFCDYDIITFWGVIEHVPEPMRMLQTASRALSGREGLIIAEVPRWNCLSTTIQSVFSNSIVRHLDPLGHINCFTDSSLATAFKENDIDIVAAWYFGMDAYELATQIAYQLHEDKIIQSMGEYIPSLQNRLDLARLSDEMVFLGIP